MLHGYIFISHPLCLVLSIYQRLIEIAVNTHISAADLGTFCQYAIYLCLEYIHIYSHLFNELRNQASLYPQHCRQQMILAHLLMTVIHGNLLTFLYYFL